MPAPEQGNSLPENSFNKCQVDMIVDDSETVTKIRTVFNFNGNNYQKVNLIVDSQSHGHGHASASSTNVQQPPTVELEGRHLC